MQNGILLQVSRSHPAQDVRRYKLDAVRWAINPKHARRFVKTPIQIIKIPENPMEAGIFVKLRYSRQTLLVGGI